MLVAFDSSLSGKGAILQTCVVRLRDSATKPIVAHWRDQRPDPDMQVQKVHRNYPAGQARLEAYVLLTSIKTWLPLLKESQGGFAMMGDALGIHHDLVRMRTKDLVLLHVAAELALTVTPLGFDVRAVHLWSEHHRLCDRLSRLRHGWHLDHPHLSSATLSVRSAAY